MEMAETYSSLMRSHTKGAVTYRGKKSSLAENICIILLQFFVKMTKPNFKYSLFLLDLILKVNITKPIKHEIIRYVSSLKPEMYPLRK